MKNQSNTKFTLALLPLLLLSSYPPLTFAASEFVKDTKTGCKVYADLDDANESATWSGVCVDGKISGKGKLTTINKKTNVTCENNGEWKAGFIAGHNIIDCSNGFHFEGDNTPAGGVAKGNGTFIFPNGHKYVGEFKSRTLHGQGTYTDASGKSMSGTFENNKLVKLDTGAITDASGKVTSGKFENGKLVKLDAGAGSATNNTAIYKEIATVEQGDWTKDPETGCEIHNKWHAQKVTWSGACVVGKANGQGTAIAETTYAGATEFTIVRTFKGEMLNGKANGYGEFVDDRERSIFVDDFENYLADYDEGSSYKGTFINGNLDKGVLVMGDKRYEGSFVNNRLKVKGHLLTKIKIIMKVIL
jgi:hypothetical protein